VDTGCELLLDPRSQQVAVRRLTPTNAVVLGGVGVTLPVSQPVPVRVRAQANRVCVWIGDPVSRAPTLEVTDSAPVQSAGAVGVRAWGAAMHLEQFRVLPCGAPAIGLPRRSADQIAHQALEALCLLLLNLNEVAYVD
jgi:hypothetical protein